MKKIAWLLKRLLCVVGIHWSGTTGLGIWGDAGRCDICRLSTYGMHIVHWRPEETSQERDPPFSNGFLYPDYKESDYE